MAANLTRVVWRCYARPGRGRLETCPFRGVKRTFAKGMGMLSGPNGREQEISFTASAFQDRLVLGAVVKLLRSFDRRKFRDY
jgi:hypothetical protein